MGNPFLAGSDGGPCIDCQHCRGFQTQPGRPTPVCLCGRDTPTFNWWGGNVVTGCRYFQPLAGWEKLAERGQKPPS